MAAIFSFPIIVPGGAVPRTPVFSTLRLELRRPMYLGASAARLLAAAGEIFFFLWTVLALAFSLLIVAGFFV
jgi:hypothetical protein